MNNLFQEVKQICLNSRKSSYEIAVLGKEKKNKLLIDAAENIYKRKREILEANLKDLKQSKKKKLANSLLDRLLLDNERIEAMCNGILEISKLNDPVGEVISKWSRPNGLKIEKVSVPLGVIGVIYESRPNVAADASALCLKSGNSVILRGGSESFNSSNAIINAIKDSYQKNGLSADALQTLPTVSRDAVGYLLKMSEFIDVIIPRGGRSLIQRVEKESKIPVFRHLDGICHTYIHKSGDIKIAHDVLVNAKMRRPGICGATETLLIDKEIIKTHLPKIIKKLKKLNCEIRGDKEILKMDDSIKKAFSKDWKTEYLDAIISIKTIKDGVDEAVTHINTFGSGHTDSIISEDKKVTDYFLNNIDSGIVMHNTSTQFADGGEFGMGAEIGISTSKLHARGPVGVSQLTSFKYKVRGNGQIRP